MSLSASYRILRVSTWNESAGKQLSSAQNKSSIQKPEQEKQNLYEIQDGKRRSEARIIMDKFYKITLIVFAQLLYALTVGGMIVALYCRQLVIALLCAAASSLLRPFWKYIEE